MWKTHFIICGAILLFAIPVYFLESAMLKRGGGGGFIMLDLSGIFIIPYLIFTGLHILISSISVKLLTPAALAPVHFWSGVAAVACIVVGFFAYSGWERYKDSAQYSRLLEQADEKRKVIQIKEWWFVPNEDHPQEVHVAIHFTQAGRFAGHVIGEELSDTYEQYFTSEDIPQRMVEAGEEFVQVFPLRVHKDGKAPLVSINLSLFKQKKGPDPEDVILSYETDPLNEVDGWTIYCKLPPPVAK